MIGLQTLHPVPFRSEEKRAASIPVLFLVDDKAAWTTGSTITMNGGTHMY